MLAHTHTNCLQDRKIPRKGVGVPKKAWEFPPIVSATMGTLARRQYPKCVRTLLVVSDNNQHDNVRPIGSSNYVIPEGEKIWTRANMG